MALCRCRHVDHAGVLDLDVQRLAGHLVRHLECEEVAVASSRRSGCRRSRSRCTGRPRSGSSWLVAVAGPLVAVRPCDVHPELGGDVAVGGVVADLFSGDPIGTGAMYSATASRVSVTSSTPSSCTKYDGTVVVGLHLEPVRVRLLGDRRRSRWPPRPVVRSRSSRSLPAVVVADETLPGRNTTPAWAPESAARCRRSACGHQLDRSTANPAKPISHHQHEHEPDEARTARSSCQRRARRVTTSGETTGQPHAHWSAGSGSSRITVWPSTITGAPEDAGDVGVAGLHVHPDRIDRGPARVHVRPRPGGLREDLGRRVVENLMHDEVHPPVMFGPGTRRWALRRSTTC